MPKEMMVEVYVATAIREIFMQKISFWIQVTSCYCASNNKFRVKINFVLRTKINYQWQFPPDLWYSILSIIILVIQTTCTCSLLTYGAGYLSLNLQVYVCVWLCGEGGKFIQPSLSSKWLDVRRLFTCPSIAIEMGCGMITAIKS